MPGHALPAASSGPLTDAFETGVAPRCGKHSAYLALPDNPDAMRWRLMLADLATQSIDVQYYLWNRDESGRLLLLHLIEAADRGVRVRMLVDDVFLFSADRGIAELDSHPNIEVRIFNPWQRRGSLLQRALEFFGRAKKLNQRMHNKLFVTDNRVAIVGGRNIGNAYFGLSGGYNFRDLELVGTGPVVQDISESFDLYWNDPWATPGAAFAQPGQTSPVLENRREQLTAELASSVMLQQAQLHIPESWPSYLAQLAAAPCSRQSWVVYDDPPTSITLDEGVRKIEKLRDLLPYIHRELLIASPYFIPTPEFLQNLGELTQRGVRIRVLTNSLASTNHTMVNSGYRPWRRPLLEAGIELFEYRADAENSGQVLANGIQGKSATLHTKAFVIDREMVYVGSLNLDPRSLHINTEMGLLIQNPRLALEVAGVLEQDMAPENAWQLSLGENGELQWQSGAGIRHLQPARHFGQRIADTLFGLLPIKDQL